ncbi:MAG: hypothetical protein AAGM67_00725 [Bacteroidota bacterium]
MTRKKRGPFAYLVSALLLPTCLLLASKDWLGDPSSMQVAVFFCFFFLALSVLWDVVGMISLLKAKVQRQTVIEVSLILAQVVVYILLWQSLGIEIGEISVG